MTYPISLRTPFSMIKHYNKKTNILSAFNHLSKFIHELIKSAKNGQKPNGEYKEMHKQYLIRLNISTQTIELSIRDTNTLNQHNRPFVIVHLKYDFVQRKITKNKYEIPYMPIWDQGDFYSCSLDEFQEGRELIQFICELVVEMEQKKRMTIPEPVNSEKEKMRNEVQYYKNQGSILFSKEPLSEPFRKLIDSLIYITEHIEELNSVENRYQIQRMINVELKDIFILFEKVNKQEEWVETHQFADIFNAMSDFVKSCKSNPFTDTKREMEKQTKILKERYIKKQVHI